MGKFTFTQTEIPGVVVIEPQVFGDDRGYFMETYNQQDMHEAGLDMVFVQDNQSSSTKGVLRGLHFQKQFPQGKLVRVVRGKVFDENFLMAVATLGAFGVGEFPEVVAVMLFYQVGELFQSYAVDKSRKSISSLMDIRPDYANVLRDEKEEKIELNELTLLGMDKISAYIALLFLSAESDYELVQEEFYSDLYVVRGEHGTVES